jgi:hypothetical protein
MEVVAGAASLGEGPAVTETAASTRMEKISLQKRIVSVLVVV